MGRPPLYLLLIAALGVATAPGFARAHHLPLVETTAAFAADPCEPSIGAIDAEGEHATFVRAGAFQYLQGIAVDTNGDLLVAEVFDPSISRVDPVTGVRGLLSAEGLLDWPRGLALHPSGDLLVVDSDARRILRIDTQTGAQSTFQNLSQTFEPFGVAVDAQGRAIVVDPEQRTILRASPGGLELVSFGGLLSAPTDVSVEESGDLLVADAATASIVRVDAQTGTQTLLFGGLQHGVADVAVGPNGQLFTSSRGVVSRVDPATGEQTIVASGGHLVAPNDVAIDSAGQLLVTDWRAGPNRWGAVLSIDPASGEQSPIVTGFESGIINPLSVVIEADGSLVVGYLDCIVCVPSLQRIDPATGAVSPLSTGGLFAIPRPAAVALDGGVLVVDSGRIIRVDPATGEQVRIYEGAATDVAVDAAGYWWVADLAAGSLLRIDPATGIPTPIPHSDDLGRPQWLAIDGDGSVLVVPRQQGDLISIIRFDPHTGGQTSIARGGYTPSSPSRSMRTGTPSWPTSTTACSAMAASCASTPRPGAKLSSTRTRAATPSPRRWSSAPMGRCSSASTLRVGSFASIPPPAKRRWSPEGGAWRRRSESRSPRTGSSSWPTGTLRRSSAQIPRRGRSGWSPGAGASSRPWTWPSMERASSW